jgi:Uma2 family endonuclease
MGEPKLESFTYTFEEYQEIAETSESRYEYWYGNLFAMAGSSMNHARLSRNLGFLLHEQIRKKGKKCDTFMSDIRLKVKDKSVYYYPDVLVTCSEADFENGKQASEPILVAEVLSKSTALRDANEKLLAYLEMPSLQYYLMISQDRTAVRVYERAETGWNMQIFTELESHFYLPKLDITINLGELYEGVLWEIAE